MKKKPRTYRKVARRRYLHTAQKKNKSHKEIRKANGSQLRFLRRDLNSINRLLDASPQIPLDKKDHKYLLVINTLYDQQKKMYDSSTHSVEDRIVSIHQPHVRPIVRGKSQAKLRQHMDSTISGQGSEKQANHGLPASFWCLTWSNWPGWHSLVSY